jgi:integrase/recombinase XerD
LIRPAFCRAHARVLVSRLGRCHLLAIFYWSGVRFGRLSGTVSPRRQRMIEDMAARKLNPHTQAATSVAASGSPPGSNARYSDGRRGVRRVQLHLIESGASICNRNRIMTGVRFPFRVTLRRHDLAAEVWHIKEPQKLPPVLSPEEVRRVLAMATSLKARAMLTLSYGCGLRASEVARMRAGDIDSEQMIIRIVQSKGSKDVQSGADR